MKKFGIQTHGLYLTPIGGVALGESLGKSYWQEVVIALMGPVWGLIYGLVFALIYLATNNHFFGGCAFLIGAFHVFNFLPINPLDGGRVAKSIAVSISPLLAQILLWSGVAVCIWAFSQGFNFLFVLIALLAYQDANRISIAEQCRENPNKLSEFPDQIRQEILRQIRVRFLSTKEKWLALFYYGVLTCAALVLMLGFVNIAYNHPQFMRFFN